MSEVFHVRICQVLRVVRCITEAIEADDYESAIAKVQQSDEGVTDFDDPRWVETSWEMLDEQVRAATQEEITS